MELMDKQIGQEPNSTPLEIIYIDDDSNSSKSTKSCRSRKSHEKRNRKVKVERNNNTETLVISQQVKVKKKKIQCIINLTNICEHEENHYLPRQYKKVRSHKKSLKSLDEPNKSHIISLKSHCEPKKSLKTESKTHAAVYSPRESPKTISTPKTSPDIDSKAHTLQISPKTRSEPKESPDVTLKEQATLISPQISSKTLSEPSTSPTVDLKLNNTFNSPKVSPKINSMQKASPKIDLKAKFDRIVPNCLRKKCQGAICTRMTRCRGKEMKKERRKKRKHSKHNNKDKGHAAKDLKSPETIFSPISLSSLERSPSLQDISSDSFTVYSDDHLDTLIKRTRDWERKQGKSFEFKPPLSASTPKLNEVSDTESMHMRSEGDNSIATIILETQLDMDLDLYSPTYAMQNPELEAVETNIFNYQASSEHNNNKYSPAIIDTQIYKESIKMECNHEYSDTRFHSTDIDIKAFSNSASENMKENSENIQFPRIKEEHSAPNEIGVIKNGLHIQRSPEIKQEKYSPKLYNFWSDDNNYKGQSDTKYSSFEEIKQVPYNVPNIKVENSIDFTSSCENNINFKIKTEVNVEHNLQF